jgi:hypothetical protein
MGAMSSIRARLEAIEALLRGEVSDFLLYDCTYCLLRNAVICCRRRRNRRNCYTHGHYGHCHCSGVAHISSYLSQTSSSLAFFLKPILPLPS